MAELTNNQEQLRRIRFHLRKELDKWDRVELDLENGGVADFMAIEFVLDKLTPVVQSLLTQSQEAYKRELLDKLPKNELHEPELRQYGSQDSSPFFCTLCGQGELTIMENIEGGKYYCNCSYWSDPHNAYLDRSGGKWLGWKDKTHAQGVLDSQPTLTLDQVTALIKGGKDE